MWRCCNERPSGHIQQAGSSRVRLHAAQRFLDPACPPDLRKTPCAPGRAKASGEPRGPCTGVPKRRRGPEDESAHRKAASPMQPGCLGTLLRKRRRSGRSRHGYRNSRCGPRLAVPRGAGRVERRDGGRTRRPADGPAFHRPRAERDPACRHDPHQRDPWRGSRTLARHWEEDPTALRFGGLDDDDPQRAGDARRAEDRAAKPVVPGPKRAQAKPFLQPPGHQRFNPQKRPDEPRSRRSLARDGRGPSARALPPVLCGGDCPGPRRRAAAGAGDADGPDPSPPVALHPRATVAATYQLQWPGVYREKLAGAALDPMDISYVRIEEKARPRTVLGHYQRTIRPHQLHPLADGVRIDAVQETERKAETQSIDVLVTRASPRSDRPPDEPQELTVEILAVTIPALEAGPGTSPREGGAPTRRTSLAGMTMATNRPTNLPGASPGGPGSNRRTHHAADPLPAGPNRRVPCPSARPSPRKGAGFAAPAEPTFGRRAAQCKALTEAGEKFCGSCGADLAGAARAQHDRLEAALQHAARLKAECRFDEAIALLLTLRKAKDAEGRDGAGRASEMSTLCSSERDQHVERARTVEVESRELVVRHEYHEAFRRLEEIPPTRAGSPFPTPRGNPHPVGRGRAA